MKKKLGTICVLLSACLAGGPMHAACYGLVVAKPRDNPTSCEAYKTYPNQTFEECKSSINETGSQCWTDDTSVNVTVQLWENGQLIVVNGLSECTAGTPVGDPYTDSEPYYVVQSTTDGCGSGESQ